MRVRRWRGYVLGESDRTRVAIVRRSRLAALITSSPAAPAGITGNTATITLPQRRTRFLVLTIDAERPSRRRRAHFDVLSAGRVFAQIRVPIASGSGLVRFVAVVELPPNLPENLSIEARATQPVGVASVGSTKARALGFCLRRAQPAALPVIAVQHLARLVKITPAR
jgi:hypothetical protein